MNREELLAFRNKIENLLQSVPLLTRTVKEDTPLVAKLSRREKKQKEKKRAEMFQKRNMTLGAAKKPSPSELVPSKSESILFNKLAFTDADTKASKKTRLPKDPKQALAAVEKKNQSLATLREQDPKLAVHAEGKAAWAKAIDRAQGIVVRDDPKLLKKSLKRKKKLKERGKKKWEERTEKIRDDKVAKQKKRKENIENRKNASKNTKKGVNKGIKKGVRKVTKKSKK